MQNSNLKENIKETVSFIRKKTEIKPQIAIILGTGLNNLADRIEAETFIEYKDIPHFAVSTVKSHAGELILGKISGKKVVAMKGRFHYYEGYSLQEVTFPVRVMRELGAEILIVSNAAGGLNPLFELSGLMLIVDHINFTGLNPLTGPHDEELGPRFPDMSEVYDKELISLVQEVALKENIKLDKGVYLGVTGPSLETPAEYRMMRRLGADAVGMSTVAEVIVAVHAGFKILGISCITDLCLPDALQAVNIEKIIEAAEKADPKLTRLIVKVLEKM